MKPNLSHPWAQLTYARSTVLLQICSFQISLFLKHTILPWVGNNCERKINKKHKSCFALDFCQLTSELALCGIQRKASLFRPFIFWKIPRNVRMRFLNEQIQCSPNGQPKTNAKFPWHQDWSFNKLIPGHGVPSDPILASGSWRGKAFYQIRSSLRLPLELGGVSTAQSRRSTEHWHRISCSRLPTNFPLSLICLKLLNLCKLPGTMISYTYC